MIPTWVQVLIAIAAGIILSVGTTLLLDIWRRRK